MSLIMVASLLLIMASAASAPATMPASGPAPSLQQSTRAIATATVTIRIVSGVQFGSDYPANDAVADRRKAQLTDAAGQPRAAELLEFQ